MGEDLRTIKTQQNIQSHFLKLLETYNFKDITIKSLINECKINRSTFYRNYEDKYDLIYKITEELITKFKKNINAQFIIDYSLVIAPVVADLCTTPVALSAPPNSYQNNSQS